MKFSLVEEVGSVFLFQGQILSTLVRKGCRGVDVVDQIWTVSLQSAPTTALAGFFVGAIMSVQFALLARDFGALGYLGGLATSATVREVGALLVAFMLSGKVGAFTAAELGTMRVTEQIDALRCLGADPLREIILPRYIGIVFSSFLLLGLGLVTSVLGGMLLGQFFAGVSPEAYLWHIPTLLSLPSVLTGFFKAAVFAVVIATICTYRGYTASGGAQGVGKAVVSTAVSTLVCLVVADFATSTIADAAFNVFRSLS